jgi:hypothetical protein
MNTIPREASLCNGGRRVRHEHRVDICLVEQWHWGGDHWGDPNLGRLVDLALVACLNIPPNIVSKRRPLETIEKST